MLLLSSLMLDIYEKITDREFRNNQWWTSHIDGALALIRFRGFEQFQNILECRVLSRFGVHHVTTCVINGSPVPDDVAAIKAYLVNCQIFPNLTSQRLDVLIDYASWQAKLRGKSWSGDECIKASSELDDRIQAVNQFMPLDWKYSTTVLEHHADRNFESYYHTYPDRIVCQSHNLFRLMRIQINDFLIDHCSRLSTHDQFLTLIEAARDKIRKMVSEICASVPDYMDCDGPARERLPAPQKSEAQDQGSNCAPDHGPKQTSHVHTPDHQADVHSLIFPLYAAGRAKAVPDARLWVIGRLHYMASHFNISDAECVAQMLERGADVCPWEAYALLGSYGFTY
ncbi:MAG: hypothetical protein M1821_009339 [Bathelium mastoideum]|nr:MAG: hypothetical protein M1821_009339 [Bathelium mastoideum]